MGLPDARILFTVGHETFDWSDVKRAAERLGDARAVESRVRQGLAALRFLEADESDITMEELEAAMDAFREERNLLAAEEMTAWLEARGLDVDAWSDFVERDLARRRCEDSLGTIAAEFPIDEDDVAAATECALVCSGAAASVALRLAAAAGYAAARRTEPPAEQSPEARIAALAAALEALRTEAVSEEAIARTIESRRLDWTAVECGMASFDTEDAAREAFLCVMEEDQSLEAIASAAGTTVEEATFLLHELDRDLQPRLLSTEPGAVVGPIRWQDRPTLLLVLDKRPPRADDARSRALAVEALTAAAIEREAGAARFRLVP